MNRVDPRNLVWEICFKSDTELSQQQIASTSQPPYPNYLKIGFSYCPLKIIWVSAKKPSQYLMYSMSQYVWIHNTYMGGFLKLKNSLSSIKETVLSQRNLGISLLIQCDRWQVILIFCLKFLYSEPVEDNFYLKVKKYTQTTLLKSVFVWLKKVTMGVTFFLFDSVLKI